MSSSENEEKGAGHGAWTFVRDAFGDVLGIPVRFNAPLSAASARAPTVVDESQALTPEGWLSWGRDGIRGLGWIQWWKGSPAAMFGAEDLHEELLAKLAGNTPLGGEAVLNPLSARGLMSSYHMFAIHGDDAYELVEPMRMWGGCLGIYPAPGFLSPGAAVVLIPKAHRRSSRLAPMFWRAGLPSVERLLQSALRWQRMHDDHPQAMTG